MEDTGGTDAYDLVLGGTGDIGRRLVERLKDPVAVSRSGGDTGTGAEVVRADVTEAVPVDMEEVDTVYHLATLNSYGHPAPPMDSPDVAGTERLVEAIGELPEDRRPELVYVSSAAAIDPPEDGGDEIGYGAAKARGEEIAGGVDATVVRPGSVYGDGKGVISYFLDRAEEGEPLTVYGDGSQLRPFVHVDDAVDAILEAPLRGDMEVAEGHYSLDEVAGMIDDRAGVGWEYEEAETCSVELSGEMDRYQGVRDLQEYVEERL